MMHLSADLVRKAESFAAVCVCTATRMVRGCPRHSPGDTGTPESHHHMLIRIIENQEKIMTALDNLQAADAALKSEVATALTDFATALQNSGSANDPAIQAVADDMNAMVTQLQGADPANAAPAAPAEPAAPSDGGTPVDGGDTGTAS